MVALPVSMALLIFCQIYLSISMVSAFIDAIRLQNRVGYLRLRSELSNHKRCLYFHGSKLEKLKLPSSLRANLYQEEDDDDGGYNEGMKLARQFSETLRLRDIKQSPSSLAPEIIGAKDDLKNDSPAEREATFSARKDISQPGKDVSFFSPTKNKKFTGAMSTFERDLDASDASSDRRKTREMANIGDEFMFMNQAAAEKTILLQGVFALLMLVATITVGMMGGITNGSERDFGGDDEFDTDTTVLFDDSRKELMEERVEPSRSLNDWSKDASTWI